jgi:hypothetical protein
LAPLKFTGTPAATDPVGSGQGLVAVTGHGLQTRPGAAHVARATGKLVLGELVAAEANTAMPPALSNAANRPRRTHPFTLDVIVGSPLVPGSLGMV